MGFLVAMVACHDMLYRPVLRHAFEVLSNLPNYVEEIVNFRRRYAVYYDILVSIGLLSFSQAL